MDIPVKCKQCYSNPQFSQELGYPINPRMTQTLGLYPFFNSVDQVEVKKTVPGRDGRHREKRNLIWWLHLLIIVLLLATGCREQGGTVVNRVILIGLDGLEWRVVEPLVANGTMPNLARFLERGASGRLLTLLPTLSPSIWATVATGKLPDEHGIEGFVRRVAYTSTRVPYTSNTRRVKALWNMLSERVTGRTPLRVAIVGWWTTWPAEPVNGVMISDRMMYSRFNPWLGLPRYGEELPEQTYPPALFSHLADLAEVRAEELEAEFLARFIPGEAGSVLSQEDHRIHDPRYELALAYNRDEGYRKMVERVLAEETFDFVAYYINGIDIASHYFWKYRFPKEWPDGVAPVDVRKYGEVIARYYAYVDESIGPLLDQASEHCLVMVVSDHGFVTGRRDDTPNVSGIHYNVAPPGVIAMAGGSVEAGARVKEATVLDIAPTVLHLLGRPVPRDMKGRVLPPVMKSGRRPVEYIDTYERASQSPESRDPKASRADEKMLETLKSLGYIK
ncbi:MAG: alkaline phosphatase family protein [bacterium]